MLSDDDRTIRDLEKFLEQSAKVHDANNFFLLQTISGVGRIIAMTLLYETHTVMLRRKEVFDINRMIR